MSKRSKMLASVIRDVIAPVLRECPQECGIVSITEVEVSSDFSYATVYISAFSEPDLALTSLHSRLPNLKKSMGSLYRKRIPEVRFRLDRRGDKGARIDEILSQELPDV